MTPETRTRGTGQPAVPPRSGPFAPAGERIVPWDGERCEREDSKKSGNLDITRKPDRMFDAMTHSSKLLSAAALIVAGALVSTSAVAVRGAQSKTPKQIVLIAGRPSHPPGMHEFRAGSLLLQKALSGVKGVTVDVIPMGWPTKIVDGKAVDDHAALDGADAVFIYADG